MRYIVYPQMEPLVARLDIDRRLHASEERQFLRSPGYLYEHTKQAVLDELAEAGVAFDARLRQPLKPLWDTRRPHQVLSEQCDDPFFALSGYTTFKLFGATDDEFGFGSIANRNGIVHAAVVNSQPVDREGHSFTSTHKDSVYRTAINGADHGDLSITQHNITPYITYDPLGNQVEYRPTLSHDLSIVSAGQDQEPDLLAAIAAYVAQTNAPSQLREKATALAFSETLMALPHNGPWGKGNKPSPYASWFAEHRTFPLPTLIGDEPSAHSIHSIGGGSHISYAAYVSETSDFVIARQHTETNQKKATIIVPAQDIDELVVALYRQAAGLGRTSRAELHSVLEAMY